MDALAGRLPGLVAPVGPFSAAHRQALGALERADVLPVAVGAMPFFHGARLLPAALFAFAVYAFSFAPSPRPRPAPSG